MSFNLMGPVQVRIGPDSKMSIVSARGKILRVRAESNDFLIRIRHAETASKLVSVDNGSHFQTTAASL